MGRILIEVLLCGFPVALLFLSLHQIASWEASSFRWGIPVLKFSESFPIKVPKHLTNKIIEHEGINFKFISQKLGLFRSAVKGRYYIGPSSLFPLLGEIITDEKHVSNVIIRIPYSIILLAVFTLISLLGFIFLSKDADHNLSSTIIPVLFFTVFTVFAAFLLLIEIGQLDDGFQKIKEYILENTWL